MDTRSAIAIGFLLMMLLSFLANEANSEIGLTINGENGRKKSSHKHDDCHQRGSQERHMKNVGFFFHGVKRSAHGGGVGGSGGGGVGGGVGGGTNGGGGGGASLSRPHNGSSQVKVACIWFLFIKVIFLLR